MTKYFYQKEAAGKQNNKAKSFWIKIIKVQISC